MLINIEGKEINNGTVEVDYDDIELFTYKEALNIAKYFLDKVEEDIDDLLASRHKLLNNKVNQRIKKDIEK